MKKLVQRVLLFVVFAAIGQLAKAQNIGVNNNNPATSLDVNGAISTREGAALNLSNGANNNIGISTFGFFRITGPTAAYNLTGFAGGNNGRLLIVINNTSQAMTIKANDAGSTTANQIQTPNGQDLAIPPSGTATLQYNSTNSKWYVVSSQTEPNYWTLAGTNLYNNAGTNIGIGVNTPTNKLHISGVDPLKIETLSGGVASDSIMTIDPSGVVRRRSVASIATQITGTLTANNGLTKNGTNIKMGGTLIENTEINQGAFTMSFTGSSNFGIGTNAPTNRFHISAAANPLRLEGLQGGISADSIVTADGTGVIRRRTLSDVLAGGNQTFWRTVGNAGTNPSTNFIGTTDAQPLVFKTSGTETGRFLTGGNFAIGNTTGSNRLHVTAASNPVRFEGIQGGATADSLVTADATGVLRQRTVASVVGGAITADNGLNKNTANNVRLGGTLLQNTTVGQGAFTMSFDGTSNLGMGNAAPSNRLHVTSASNPVRFEGIVGGAVADSLVTADATGVLRKRTVASVVGGAFTADNGLTKNTANNVQLGGALLKNTDVATAGFNVTYSGTGSVSVGNAAPSNRLHVTAAANPVRFEGIQGGAVADSLVTADATGVLRQRTVASVVGGAITANNGLTKNTANNVQLGGTLLQNTAVDQAAFTMTYGGTGNFLHTTTGNVSVGNAAPSNKLHVTAASNPVRFEGIVGGAVADSLVTADANGVLRQRTVASVVGGAITANNGLTKNTANNVQLGGTLLQNTTVDQSTFNMVYSGTGNFGIGTASPAQKLDVTGNIAVAGNIFTSSDIRFKKNVTTLSGSLDKLMKLRGTEYDWKVKEFPAKNFDNRHQIGFIAQELEKVFPELVTTAKDGYKSVDYTHIVPVLVEAMKEQQKMIEQLKLENSTLTTSNAQNNAKVEDLSKQMSNLTDMVKSLLTKETSSTKVMSEK